MSASDFKVLFQDSDLMVIDKPPGLVVTPSDTHHETTVAEILQTEFKIDIDRGGVVHRIDKDTSGLLVVAKTQNSLENLQLQFKERMVKKEYLALGHGLLEKSETVKGAIERNPGNREKFIVSEEGRESETRFEPEAHYHLSSIKYQEIFESFNKIQMRKLERSNYGQFTLIRCFPLTGRTHQIRVHLKYINHPIVGDEKYAGRKTARQDRRWCPRQFLHAARLNFYHPKTGERLEYESPLPEDLEQVMNNLEEIRNSNNEIRNNT